MTHLYDDTTLTRAVLLFGPLFTEHQFIRAAAKVNRAAGILTDALMRLQENLYPSPVEIENAITDLKAVLPGLDVAAEQVAELRASFDRIERLLGDLFANKRTAGKDV